VYSIRNGVIATVRFSNSVVGGCVANIGEADAGAVVKEESAAGTNVAILGKGDVNNCDGDTVTELVGNMVELPAVGASKSSTADGISVVAVPEGIVVISTDVGSVVTSTRVGGAVTIEGVGPVVRMDNVGGNVCCCIGAPVSLIVGAEVADGIRVGTKVCIDVRTVCSTGPLGADDSSQLYLLALVLLFLLLFDDFELFDFLAAFGEVEDFFLLRILLLLFAFAQEFLSFPFSFFFFLLLLVSFDEGAGDDVGTSSLFDDLLLLPLFFLLLLEELLATEVGDGETVSSSLLLDALLPLGDVSMADFDDANFLLLLPFLEPLFPFRLVVL